MGETLGREQGRGPDSCSGPPTTTNKQRALDYKNVSTTRHHNTTCNTQNDTLGAHPPCCRCGLFSPPPSHHHRHCITTALKAPLHINFPLKCYVEFASSVSLCVPFLHPSHPPVCSAEQCHVSRNTALLPLPPFLPPPPFPSPLPPTSPCSLSLTRCLLPAIVCCCWAT